MKSSCLRLYAGLTIAATLAACDGEARKAIVPASTSTSAPVAGEHRGEYFYPQFQHWSIVKVVPVAGAKIPADAGGIPTILRGRSVFLSANYLTLPFLNAPGEVLTPACFKTTSSGLVADTIDARVGAKPETVLFRSGADRRLSFIYGGVFELTLSPTALPADGGYQQRGLDAHFNARVNRERQGGAAPGCELNAVTLPPLVHRDLEWYAPATGQRIVVAGADRDPETPMDFDGMSYESRSPVDATQAGNTIAGCAGESLVVRLAGGRPVEDVLGPSQDFILGSLAGRDAAGQECARVKFLRRIDTEKLLVLFDIPPPISLSGRSPGVQLVDWVRPEVLRVKVGGIEFELSEVTTSRIAATMVSEIPKTAPLHPLAPPPPEALAQRNEPEPPRPGETKMHRWVDENGVVNYSDRAAEPAHR